MSFDSASGTLAAEVLPDSTMSLAITAMMRPLAWCGTNAAMSSGATPARSQACSASGASAVVAQRNTAWPSCCTYPRQPSIRTASLFSGTEPQTTGPTPGASPSAVAVTTAAPAPSPKMMQVERSVQSVKSDSFSAPMTIALRTAPARIAWSTVPRAYEKPEQAVLMSYAPGAAMPSLAATRQATLGLRSTEVQVATTTRSMS